MRKSSAVSNRPSNNIPACSSAYTANFWSGVQQQQSQEQEQQLGGDYETAPAAAAAAVAKPEPSSSPLGCPTPESVHSNCSGSEAADSSFLQVHSPENGSPKGKGGGRGKGREGSLGRH